MSDAEDHPTELITPETIATYLAGPPAESADFDFLLGDWEQETTRYDETGAKRQSHRGTWSARHLAGGRIVLDETTAVRDDGSPISSMATLRTYSPVTGRWEMTFLSAHQPVLPIAFTGSRVGSELHLEVRPTAAPEGPLLARVRFHRIEADRFEWEQYLRFGDADDFRRTVSISARRV